MTTPSTALPAGAGRARPRTRSAGRRAFAGVLLCLSAVVVAPAAGGVGPAAAAAAPSASPPPPPECAADLAPFLGVGGPTPSPSPTPAPLPAPVSTVGGARLAASGRQVDLPPGTPAPPLVRATAWLVADLDTGAVLASCNAHVPLAPASTLKTLTALALWPAVPVGVLYQAQQADAAIDGTRAGLVPGSVYTGDNLWHGLLMSSGNDCANALATLAGGLPVATSLMERTARRLGAADTVVRNTSGLDEPDQVSSAYDLALFGRAMLADPALIAISRTRDYLFPDKGTTVHGESGRTAYQIQNHNRLLYNYAGATGVKNGYTTKAGGSFVGSATRGGHSYIVTMLRADTDTWRATAALLDWAFAAGRSARPVGTLDVGPVSDAARAGLSPTASDGTGTAAAGSAGPGSAAPGSAGGGAQGGADAAGSTTTGGGQVVAAATGAGSTADGGLLSSLALRIGVAVALLGAAGYLAATALGRRSRGPRPRRRA